MAICKAAVNQSNLAYNMNQFLTNHWLGLIVDMYLWSKKPNTS